MMSRDWKTVLAEHAGVVGRLDAAGETLNRIADAIIACFRDGGRVFLFGNGGSAADAQHIAGELLGRYKLKRAALSAMALTTDTSTFTAIANDIGYEYIFSRQIEGLVRPGDIAWALSTSGKSPNVLNAVRAANERGALTIGFAGESGGELAGLCTHAFCAPHSASDRIQEAHELAYHYVCERVEAALAG
ncbi:MAG: SIS domain-containing protein [Planctomycetes bacterium]|nr:SIS domain-containing protein [Planctomycetota bacterium]